MAIKGVARFHKDRKKHIITTQTVRIPPCEHVFPRSRPAQEHKCVLDSCRKLQEEGLVGAEVEQALRPMYDNAVQVLRFEIPLDMVEILSMEYASQVVTGSDG